MTFTAILGNEVNKKTLEKLLVDEKVPHLFLFTGSQGIGKRQFAYATAARLLKTNISNSVTDFSHPDLLELKVEGKTGLHSIHSIRKMQDMLSLKPYLAPKKVCIIDDAERMLPQASNALLKLLEEPPPHTHIFLITAKKENLLPTILSRAQLLRFHPLTANEMKFFLTKKKVTEVQIQKIVTRSRGSCGLALKLARDSENQSFTKLHTLLLQTHIAHFQELSDFCKEFQESCDGKRKILEKELKKEFIANSKEMNSVQRQQLEHEMEGGLFLFMSEMIDEFFDEVIIFFRDLYYVQAYGGNVDPVLLNYPDYKELYVQAVQKKAYPAVDEVSNAIKSSKLAFERSLSIQNILKTLFLQLNVL